MPRDGISVTGILATAEDAVAQAELCLTLVEPEIGSADRRLRLGRASHALAEAAEELRGLL